MKATQEQSGLLWGKYMNTCSDQAGVRAWILLRNSNSRHFYLELLTNTYISVRSLWDLVCKLLNICSSSTKRGKAGNSKWSLANILHCIPATSKTDENWTFLAGPFLISKHGLYNTPLSGKKYRAASWQPPCCLAMHTIIQLHSNCITLYFSEV